MYFPMSSATLYFAPPELAESYGPAAYKHYVPTGLTQQEI